MTKIHVQYLTSVGFRRQAFGGEFLATGFWRRTFGGVFSVAVFAADFHLFGFADSRSTAGPSGSFHVIHPITNREAPTVAAKPLETLIFRDHF